MNPLDTISIAVEKVNEDRKKFHIANCPKEGQALTQVEKGGLCKNATELVDLTAGKVIICSNQHNHFGKGHILCPHNKVWEKKGCC